MNIETIKEELRKPFPDAAIRWRKQRDMWLAYVTAHQVEQRLDNIVGFENWECEYYEVAGKVYCRLTLDINGKKISKSDCGAESNFDADKGQASDAFKRAAKRFGIGRSLWLNPPTHNQ